MALLSKGKHATCHVHFNATVGSRTTMQANINLYAGHTVTHHTLRSLIHALALLGSYDQAAHTTTMLPACCCETDWHRLGSISKASAE